MESRLLKTAFGSPKEPPNRALSVAALDRAASGNLQSRPYNPAQLLLISPLSLAGRTLVASIHLPPTRDRAVRLDDRARRSPAKRKSARA